MGTIIAVVRLALALVPEIIATIRAVELPGSGTAKAQAVVDLVKAALDLVPDELAKLVKLDKIEGFVRKVIDIVVSLLNAAGVFKKSAAA